MKKISIVIMILLMCVLASAQGFKIGAAGNVVFPLGDFADATSSPGYGVDAFGVFDLMVLTVTARVGYLSFGEKEVDVAPGVSYKSSVKAIPIMAGLRWEFGAPVGPSFYAGVEAGVHNFTTEISGGGVSFPDADESKSKFAVSPNVGIELLGLDVSAYYMYIKDASYWGVRLGYGLGI
jgi:hypothetical protein